MMLRTWLSTVRSEMNSRVPSWTPFWSGRCLSLPPSRCSAAGTGGRPGTAQRPGSRTGTPRQSPPAAEHPLPGSESQGEPMTSNESDSASGEQIGNLGAALRSCQEDFARNHRRGKSGRDNRAAIKLRCPPMTQLSDAGPASPALSVFKPGRANHTRATFPTQPATSPCAPLRFTPIGSANA